MPLSIKNPTADRLVNELTTATGETITQAVVTALQERLDRVRGQRASAIERRLKTLGAELRSHPVSDSRPVEEILGYDEHGLPR
jgi:antitoxin VapB